MIFKNPLNYFKISGRKIFIREMWKLLSLLLGSVTVKYSVPIVSYLISGRGYQRETVRAAVQPPRGVHH